MTLVVLVIAMGAAVFILLGYQNAGAGLDVEIIDAPAVAPVASKAPAMTASPTPAAPSIEPTPTPVPTLSPEEQALAEMSTEQKIGQLVMFGFDKDAPGERFKSIFEKYHCGSVMLYGWNVSSFEQAAGLIDEINALNQNDALPLFIGLDVEGGTVVRFNWDPKTRSALSLGNEGDETAVFDQFERIGSKLDEIGVNMDFAPVLDVAPDPEETFLGTRIYGSDPGLVSKMGVAAVEGLHAGGVLSVGKHFPGHGGTQDDSHETTPVVEKSGVELAGYDLLPFRAAVEAGVDAMLVAHILYPQISGDVASVSQEIIGGILREDMGFTGVVISDDMRMKGITSRYGVGEAAVKFILAGGDIILCGPHYDKQEAIITALAEAVDDGTITEERLNESVLRIINKKLKLKSE